MDENDYKISVCLFNLTEAIGKLNAFILREDKIREKRLITAMEITSPTDGKNNNEKFRRSQELRKKFHPFR